MGILKKAKLEMAYLKAGLYGRAGSGKTHTSSKIAIGLHKFIEAKKPVAFSDTETGSDFVIPMFEKAGVELLVTKSRAFKDLLEAGREAEKECSVWIVDSITHFWNELMDAYQKKHNKPRLYLRDWIPLKQVWREFTDLYVNSGLHIILCGRGGDVWEDVEDDEGVLETKKTGTKMKAEIETAFEPSLLVEMTRHRTSARPGAGWIHRAWVEKDRFDLIDGKYFDDPGFDDFLPHIEKLNLSGEHRALDKDRNSQELFTTGNNNYERQKKHDILIEKIEAEIHTLIPGSANSSGVKEKRLKLMDEIFGTKSRKEIEGMDNDTLEDRFFALQEKVIEAQRGSDKSEPKPKKSNKKEKKS